MTNGRRMSDRLPYGWKAAPDHVVNLSNGKKIVHRMMEPDAEEQAVIQKMVDMHVNQGLTFRGICRALAEEGIKCRGNGWYHSTVKDALDREEMHRSPGNGLAEPLP